MTITWKTCVATLFDLHPGRSDHFTPELDVLADLLRKLANDPKHTYLSPELGGGQLVGGAGSKLVQNWIATGVAHRSPAEFLLKLVAAFPQPQPRPAGKSPTPIDTTEDEPNP